MDLKMYLNCCLAKYRKKYESLFAKIHLFDAVRVWLCLTLSTLDFNVLVILKMHFGIGTDQCHMSYRVKTIVEASVKVKFAYVYNTKMTYSGYLHTDYEHAQTLFSRVKGSLV
jgi:arginine/ornithine N-succinyltransferase beta subunit